jgi:hypothetical protein
LTFLKLYCFITTEILRCFHYLERAVLDGACSDEGNNHGDHVDSELELQEFCDAVVHVAAPHDRLHDAAEVVVSQDDVGRLLGYVCARNTLNNTTIVAIHIFFANKA